ncbi:MAG: L-lactate permease [Gemmatimonadota bacterium]
MTWTQEYTPLGTIGLSALVASLPVVVLLGLLAWFRVRAHIAALAGLATALVLAVLVFGMPADLALASALNGAAYGLFPIGWIVLAAIFVYDITVVTGKFEVLRAAVAGIADDRRLQALLIAFSFGAFIEGAAGFGTPVAITAAMLIGLGFRPLSAAGLSLIGNTAPVAFGALGTPIIALARVTGLPIEQLSAMVGRQLPVFSLIVPFWLVWTMAGWKGTKEVWPACLVSGATFGLVQFLVSNYHGPWLVDIAGSLVSIGALLVLLRYWRPAARWSFPGEERSGASLVAVSPGRRETVAALAPWIVLSVLVFLWGVPQIKALLNEFSAPSFEVARLHGNVLRAPPVSPTPRAEDAIFQLNWISATGTALLLSGIISGLMLGVRPYGLLLVFGRTLWKVRTSLLTIAAMLALGFTTRYSGIDTTMGLAFAATGWLFPFFSPLLGWLGVALTGSDTSSNVLFGNLQQVTAQQLGISPVLAAASNSTGGVMGKMIDAQSIVVARVATQQDEGEGTILRYVFFHSLALACLVGVLVFVQAYWMPWIVPR